MEVEDLIPRCPFLQERAQLLIEYMETIFKDSQACLKVLKDMIVGCPEDLWCCLCWTALSFQLLSLAISYDSSLNQSGGGGVQADQAIIPLLFKATRTWCYSMVSTGQD